jgi:hypothetical protein
MSEELGYPHFLCFSQIRTSSFWFCRKEQEISFLAAALQGDFVVSALFFVLLGCCFGGVFLFVCLETGSHYVPRLRFVILPQPPE